MIYRVFVFIAVTLTLLLGAGCSAVGENGSFRNKGDDYLRSDTVPVIEVPAGLDNSRIGQIYPIPEGGEAVSYQLDEEFVVPRPESLTANLAANEVRIQNLADDYWILVSVPPGEAWPRVRNHLTASGIPTYRTDASIGVIETSMIQFKDDAESTHQFLVQLSQGVQRGTTEVKILQRAFPKDNVPTELPSWNPVSENPEREEWLRTEMANALANDLETGTASMLGQEIGAQVKVEMVTPETADPYIRLILPYERAWGSVGYSLNREGFRIEDQDRTAGLYYASYAPPVLEEDEPGFISSLFWADPEARPRTDFHVQLRPTDQGVEVRIFRADASSLDQRDAFKLLTVIRNNLT